jgi:hypothetical protein
MDGSDRDRFFAKTKRADQPRTGMATPCLEWQAGCDKNGYGKFSLGGKAVRAHRAAWEIAHGPIPEGKLACHKCDNPSCVDDDHLFLGTDADNMADRDAKERQACGDRSGARLHPDRLSRGEVHGARMREVAARGDRNGARLYPERWARGESHYNAKLTEEGVHRIFRLRGKGWIQEKLGKEFGVSTVLIGRILARKAWAHVQPKTGVAI